MSIELKTVMGQINIVKGRWVRDAPNALAVREPSGRLRRGHAKGDLFITLEVRGDLTEPEKNEIGRSLAEMIRNTYYQSSGSITASLRRALLAANEHLRAEYQPSPERLETRSGRQFGQDGLLVGVTAVAVRGEDVFIGSVGPAITYTVIRGKVTQFPEASPWLDMSDPQATGASALGRKMGLDVQLFHVYVEPGDILVLGDSRFATHTSPARVKTAVAYQGVEGALTNLGKLTGGHDCTALVVEIQAKSDGPLREQEPTAVSRQTADHKKPRAMEPAAMPDTRSRLEVSPVDTEELVVTTRADTRDSRGLGQIQIHLPVGRWLSAMVKGVLALVMVIWTGLRTLIGRVLPGLERETATLPTTAAVQARRVRTPALPQRILRVVALVIPIAVLAAVGLTYWQRGLASENEFNSLVEQAQTSYQQALNADDSTARDLLNDAQTLLTQAAAIKPGEPTINETQSAIVEHQDKIGRVERLYWVGKLRDYEDPGALLRRVIVSGVYVYVLDTGTDQVYHHRLDEANDALEPDEGDPVLARRGQQVETSVVGEIVDMIWTPAGGNRQTSDLLILESGGLLEYNPSWGLAPVSIADKEAWGVPVAVGSYFGNFYILDPQAGQIFRYVPGTEDYTTPAQSYFSDETAVDLNGAVDIAIDGFIYVLYANGTIRKFESGEPVEFQITEIDKPLSRPTAIYTAPDDEVQFIYVADAGNQRVVQLNKDGRFVRQFKPRDEEEIDFNTLRSVFVDELTGKLYLVNDRALYIANITPLQ